MKGPWAVVRGLQPSPEGSANLNPCLLPYEVMPNYFKATQASEDLATH